MNTLLKTAFLSFLIFISLAGKSQLNGIYTVPGSFNSLAAAISSLNMGGVTGPVTINIAAGYTETTPTGGYQLGTVNGSSTSNTIIFRKNGAGANPLLTAYINGVGTPSSTSGQDGIWRFVGSDNITIDGIDLLDPNATNPATMEYGYGFFKASGTNGCQNNVVRNCVITLNQLNASYGSYYIPGGSKGIYLSGSTISSFTQAVNTNSFIGTNSGNSFYSNKIQNCNIGISLTGPDNVGYIPSSDQLNTVGGLTAASGNTIVNFGGGQGNASSYGIDASYQFSLSVLSNVIINNDGGGMDPGNRITAIRTLVNSGADLTINSNTITLRASPSNTLMLLGISNSGPANGFGTPAFININNNIFPTYASGLGSTLLGGDLISTSCLPSITTLTGNVVSSFTTGIIFGIISCARASTCTISSNTISNVLYTEPRIIELIESDAAVLQVDRNLISQVTVSGISGGNMNVIGGGYYSRVMNVSSNTISAITCNQIYGVYFYNNIGGVTHSITENDLSGFKCVPGATISTGAFGILLDNYSGYANSLVRGNSIYSFQSIGAVSSPTMSSTNVGISLSSISSATVIQNKIHSFLSDRYSSAMNGINIYAGSTGSFESRIYNNVVGNFEATDTDNRLTGIAVSARSNTISFNTVNLNSTNTGSNTTSQAFYLYSTVSTNTSSVRNNIFINELPATGTGTAMAMNIYSLTMYGSSDRNILYAGIPSANRLIAKVGANSYSVLTNFKSAVSPRDAGTFTESPVFISTVGSSANYLDLDPTVLTLAEGGARPVNGVLTDYAGTARNILSPDIGAWENNYKGYDRAAPVILSSGFTGLPCGNFTTRTFTMALLDTSGIASGALAPRFNYYINNTGYTSVQGLLTSGTSTNGVWTFNLNYNTVAGATITYFLVFQDQSVYNNVNLFPSQGGSANSVTSIQSPPNPLLSYVLQNYPTITVNSGTVCSGQAFYFYPSGASTYTYSGGVTGNSVVPLTGTSYSVTGTSSSGCPATNTAVSTVTVFITPTISVNSGSVCSGQVFTLMPTGASTYSYSGGSATVSPLNSAGYSVTGTSAEGCPATNTAVSNVVVHTTPNIHVNGGSICYGNSFTLNPTGGVTYVYSEGPVVSPLVTTTYTVTGSANDCEASAVATVVVKPLPVLNLPVTEVLLCSGETATLNVSGATTYSWEPQGGNSNPAVVDPTVSTTYTVTGTTNGCSSTSNISITVDACTSVMEHKLIPGIKIFPIPTHGELFLELPSGENSVVRIYNTSGQIVIEEKINGSSAKLDLSNLSKGIYLLELRTDQGISARNKLLLE